MILLFVTSILTGHDEEQVGNLLQGRAGILQWTVDREDCDRVLRIVTDNNPDSNTGGDPLGKLQAKDIEAILHTAGFFCKELID